MPEVVSMSVTRAEFLLCLASCWKSVEPATPRLGPRRRRLFIQKQQFLTESRKCCNNVLFDHNVNKICITLFSQK